MADTLEKTGTLLRQLQIDVLGNQNKFETCGKLAQLALLVEEAKREKTPEKRENDAPDSTRRTPTASPTPAPKGTGRKKKKGKVVNSLVSPQRPIVEVPATPEPEKTLEEEKGWNVVARKSNHAKPGDVDIRTTQASPQTPKYQGKGRPQAGTKASQGISSSPQNRGATRVPALKRDTPTIRFRINKESDWKAKVDWTTERIKDDIRQKVNNETANLIFAARVYKGGDVKIHPTPTAGSRLCDGKWIVKWVASATFAQDEFPLLVSGVPTTGTAENMAEAIVKANSPYYFGMRFTRARWLGRTEGRERATLLMSVDNPELADRLIINGMLNPTRYSGVRRWIKNFVPGQEITTPLFGAVKRDSTQASTSRASSRDSEGDLLVFSSPEISQGTGTSLKRKILETKPSEERRGRGRPTGSTNKSKLLGTAEIGPNPFIIASTPRFEGEQGVEEGEEPDTNMIE